MKIEAVSAAETDLNCFRCDALGISTPTILKGSPFIKAEGDNGVKGSACMDCYDRLAEEIEEGPHE